MNAFLANDFGLVHFFHCVHFLRFFEFDTPDFSEASLSYNILAIEVITTDFLVFQYELPFFFFIEL